jgi:hypothetical protein
VDHGKHLGNHQPSPEIEIITPDKADPSSARDSASIFVSLGGGRANAHFASPLALVFAGLIVAAMAALFVVAVLGTLLIWLPLIASFVALMAISGVVRRYFRRPR